LISINDIKQQLESHDVNGKTVIVTGFQRNADQNTVHC